MAIKSLPGPMKKREVLYSKDVPAEEKAEYGQAFLDAGNISDALAFFVEAKSKTDLQKMRSVALKDGDAFILRQVQNVFPDLVSEDDWASLAKTAAERGLDMFAEQGENGGVVELPVVDAIIQEDPTHHDGEDAEAEEEGKSE